MLILVVVTYIVIPLFIIWLFFDPTVASYSFVVFIIIFEGHILFANKINPAFRELDMNSDELAALNKYHLYFRFPFASRQYSTAISGVQLSTFIWVPWLLYNSLWVLAIIIGFNYFLTSIIAPRLNPRFYLHDAVESRGMSQYLPEMEAVDSVCEKIAELQQKNTNRIPN